MEINKLYNGDCLEIMPNIESESIDMILCDLPYSTTGCQWDCLIPFDKLWEAYERIIKINGAIVLFGVEPFSSKLRLSNPKLYKYDYVWIKNRVTNFLNAKNSPMKKFEQVMVFSKGAIANCAKNMMKYYPQGLEPLNKIRKDGDHCAENTIGSRKSRQGKEFVQQFTNYPNNVLNFDCESGLHPTQKPVSLCEHLVKTYTNEGELVLDNCVGSGSTVIGAINTKRNFIGIEKNEDYFNIASKRIMENISNES